MLPPMLMSVVTHRPSPRPYVWPSELRARARALGWTQNGLARRAGKDSGFVSRVLTGKQNAPGVYAHLVRTVVKAERRRLRRV